MKALLVLTLLCAGCGLLPGSSTPTSDRVLRLLGSAVLVEDNVCAQVASGLLDPGKTELANTCASIYAGERTGLIAAASAIDAGNEGDAICAALDVAQGLRKINDELLARGVQEPMIVRQALAALDDLAPLCPVK